MMSPKAAIFDLDGTLADSLPDIAAACNHALKLLSHPPLPVSSYATLAGGGNEILLSKLLTLSLKASPTPVELNEAVTLKMAFETGPTGHANLRPFPGILDMLTSLSSAQIPLAILSNKTQPSVRAVVAELFPDIPFLHVAGALPDTPLKPDPTAARAILTTHFPGIEPQDCVFIGDTPIDMKTAKSAGMVPLGVSWGFRPSTELLDAGAAAVATSPTDITSFILAHPPSV